MLKKVDTLDQSWKLDGSYAPEKHSNCEINVDDMNNTLHELRMEKVRLIKEMGTDAIEAEKEWMVKKLATLNGELNEDEI